MGSGPLPGGGRFLTSNGHLHNRRANFCGKQLTINKGDWEMKRLKFVKQVRDNGGFEHPILVYGKDYTRTGNRVFKSISAAVRHVASLDTRKTRR